MYVTKFKIQNEQSEEIVLCKVWIFQSEFPMKTSCSTAFNNFGKQVSNSNGMASPTHAQNSWGTRKNEFEHWLEI